jgi:hypothetical protein
MALLLGALGPNTISTGALDDFNCELNKLWRFINATIETCSVTPLATDFTRIMASGRPDSGKPLWKFPLQHGFQIRLEQSDLINSKKRL